MENSTEKMNKTAMNRGNQKASGSPYEPRAEHREGLIARQIESQTAALPSDLFLLAAGAAVLGSLALKATGANHTRLFVGEWVPTLLILGVYNKLVKVAGSDPLPGSRNP